MGKGGLGAETNQKSATLLSSNASTAYFHKVAA